jgi:hypothetical protein
VAAGPRTGQCGYAPDADPFLPHLIASEDLETRAARDMAVPAASGLFDENYYLVANNDVAESSLTPLFYFCVFSWQEGRNLNAYSGTG